MENRRPVKLRDKPFPTRQAIIDSLQHRLSGPRLQISAILLLTGFSAFVVSAILLRLGMANMGVRYPLSVIAGYAAFLLFLRIWLWWQDDSRSSGELDVSDIGVMDVVDGVSGSGSGASFSTGGRADFAGAGAGGDWEGDMPTPNAVGFVSAPPAGGGTSFADSGGGSFDLDLDDGIAFLVVALVLVIVFGIFIYVIWIAPILFAELIIDAAVVSTLYKPVKNIQRGHWLLTALKKTAIPAMIVMILLGIAGIVMQAAEPEVVTIGQFLKKFL